MSLYENNKTYIAQTKLRSICIKQDRMGKVDLLHSCS